MDSRTMTNNYFHDIETQEGSITGIYFSLFVCDKILLGSFRVAMNS